MNESEGNRRGLILKVALLMVVSALAFFVPKTCVNNSIVIGGDN